MFLLREVPSHECLQEMARRHPEMDPDKHIAILKFLRTALDVIEGFEKYLGKHGLSHGRFAVLIYLNRAPDKPVNQTQLADAYGVTKATITGLVDSLERDGIVERLPDPADRRATLVRLTDLGREFMAGFLPAHYERVAALLSGFEEGDRLALTSLMEKIKAGIAHVAELEKAGTLCRPPDMPVRRSATAEVIR